MKTTVEGRNLLISMRPETDAEDTARNSTNLSIDLRGTIEVLGDDAFFEIGQFENAIFFLPDIESIAKGISWLRQGSPKLSMDLTESPPIYVVRERRGSDLFDIRYAANTTKGYVVKVIDEAFEAALDEFLTWLTAMRGGHGIDAGAMQYLETIASVWPSIEKFLNPWRKPIQRY